MRTDDGESAMITRRTVAKGALALPLFYAQASAQTRRAFGAFSDRDDLDDVDCGVTSGNPTPDGFVLWTRVPPAGRGGDEVAVRYEVATAPDFAAGTIVATGTVTTSAARDFTVKAVVRGLRPLT